MDFPSKPDTLTEHVADWHTGLRVDRTNRTVHNVALTGVTSRNGYRYTEQALRAAINLYRDKPVFLDHAADKSRPHERSTRDLVGTIVNPRYDSGRVRGDIRVLDTDSGKTFLALSESDAPGVGMSHVVLAQRATPDGDVDRIHDVVSVDAVVFPATTKTFRESLDDSDESAGGDCTTCEPADSPGTRMPDSPQSARTRDATAPVQATAETQDVALSERLQLLLSERDELLGQLRQVRHREEAEARQEILNELLQSSGLPDFAMTALFRWQLLRADEQTRSKLIADRLQLIDLARERVPSSHERSKPHDREDVDRTFLTAIRRSGL
jgi:hypothetical protein